MDLGVRAQAWTDINANGRRDEGELPLQDVCVWWEGGLSAPSEAELVEICGSPQWHTDSDGRWPRGGGDVFVAGYHQHLLVFAKPPAGYRATTPSVVDDPTAEFGFAPVDPASAPGELDSYYVRVYRDYVDSAARADQLWQAAGIAALAGEFLLAAVAAVRWVRPPLNP